MTSLPSPALEEKRQQEHGAFLPPQFSVPMRAPVDGFPSEKDVIVPEVIRLCSKSSDGTGNARVYHGKEMLLNASPTLELPAEDAEALLTALRRHPRCAEIREELKGVNESYLEEAFGEEDAREDDTRRRVDYNAALAIMKSNSSKRLSMCTSCLTRGQHRHYYSWVKRYLEEGIIPNPTEDYPDLSTVIDLVQREQAAYRHKLKEEMIACEACKCETGYNKRTRSDEMPQQSHRACWNHNYIDEYVEQYAKQWLRYRLESQLLRGLLGGSSCGGGGGGVNFSEVICDLRKSIAASTGVKPTATLCERTRHLCAHRVAETIEERQSKGHTRVLPSAAVPPTLPLGVQWLNEREPALHTSNVAGAKVVEKDVSSQGQQQQEVAEARPPALPCKDIVGTFFTLRVCKSALFKLATAHLSSFRGEFCIPVSCTWSPSAQCLDISIEKPLPPSCESRRNISAMAMKRLVDAELRLPTRGRCSGPDGGESKCYSEVSFGADLAFLCMTNCVFDLKEPKPVFRLVKMEYNCKGYNTAPDDERTLLYENFSKKEVIYMWVLLHCNPTAALYVYRVNAYSSAVVGIEQFSSATLANQVLHEYSNDTEVQSAWSCLRDILSKLVATATRQYHQRERQHQEGMDEKSGNPEGCTFLLRKAKGHSEVSLCSVSSCYPTEPSVQDAVESFIEPAGQSVCRREYLPPCVWPFPDRIPFTYGPAPRACYTVNRTTEQRHNSEYYAKNDVWEHNLRYYTVGADGILWEQHLADGP
ncbi:hypothetical protein, conserved [Trypanosoma brucei brucei TREU927]|uniref:Uncharacterized protein n=2 Tax=Trypanosoma brucei TaxID=5691 RepID=Q38D52_TRYB2|nr:hypothetical protein, conserved [Trypanosoma brucei brucei TREU927]EAN77268.1 hypothetical protein, conserved [Trypanosoma brucei brucei TREU927]